MKKKSPKIKYPRLVLRRKAMLGIGRVLLALLADADINGKERLPKKGPMILAGNHVAVLEAVMMAIYTPGMVEFLGNGDIPFDPNYAWIANTYDLIRVNRGNLDRKALALGVDLLNQGGLLGIFPEGGTWNPAKMEAQIGIAWLSYSANAPILPIGFGGMKGALTQAFKFRKPRLTMNVGEVIPPVRLDSKKLSKKDNLQKAANDILEQINALIPEGQLQQFRRRVDENYELEVTVEDENGLINIPKEKQIEHGPAYARFLYNPTMMDVLYRNLKLPIKPIKKIFQQYQLKPTMEGWTSILNYLQVNPGYFTYRFGVEEGVAVKKALEELCQLGQWVQESGYHLTVVPSRQYRNANTDAEVTERGGCFPPSMT
jgi:1-acyl-sn-glycerol-3-phosphate acyltransferase